MKKVSVIITVLNEEGSVGGLLESLARQSRQPDEVVAVDGGSVDRTVAIIESYKDRFKALQLIKLQEASISRGRNAAIKAAKHDLIAQIDGGCVARVDWLERIVEPFNDNNVGMVAGFYEMRASNYFAEALAPFVGVPRAWFDERNFMPSGRSVAFAKKVWHEVGGYSENLDRAGEDTLFNYRVLKAGVKIARRKDALVYWDVPSSYLSAARKFYSYAKGDAQAGIWWHPAQGLSTHNIKILSIYVRYVLFVLLALLALIDFIFLVVLIFSLSFYSFFSIWKMREVVPRLKSKMLIPLIQFTSDISVMAGFASGALRK